MAIRIPVEVGSREWLEERRKGVTASEIAGLLGIAPDTWTSPFNLFWNKKAGIGQEPDNEAMAWGHDLEQVILRRFAREHPELRISPGGLYRHGERAWQMATPDGLAYERTAEGEPCPAHVDGEPIVSDCPDCETAEAEPLAVVQVKTAGSREHWGEPDTDDIPAYYLAQVRWEMDVMDVAVAYVPVLFSGHTYREYIVEQDTEDTELMRNEALQFLGRLEREEPPEVDWRAATTRTLKALHPDLEDEAAPVDPEWVRAYLIARDDEADAKLRKREAGNHIRQQLGACARGTVNDKKVVSRSISTIPAQIHQASKRDALYFTKPKEGTRS